MNVRSEPGGATSGSARRESKQGGVFWSSSSSVAPVTTSQIMPCIAPLRRCQSRRPRVRRACRVDVEAYSDIVVIHPEQLIGFDPVDCPCIRVVHIDERTVLAAEIHEAEIVVDHVGVVHVGPEADGCADPVAEAVIFLIIISERAVMVCRLDLPSGTTAYSSASIRV